MYLVGLSRLFPFGLSSQAPMWSRCARLELRSSHLHSPDNKKPRIREAFLNLVGLSRLFPFGLSSQAPMWSRCARLELRSSHLHSPDSKKPRIREAFLNLVGLSRFELLTSTMSR